MIDCASMGNNNSNSNNNNEATSHTRGCNPTPQFIYFVAANVKTPANLIFYSMFLRLCTFKLINHPDIQVTVVIICGLSQEY